ncbi:hypothetical protein PR001_g22266 [Phytophthora rubi]|uniref:Uncharacterized protein n=1 Tax=Phytophthora rubi TaxID=129364 RepID=A0A6A3IX03_9STRA|nr:hypothetical protein PR001_g22266 [Phytophthora rubi]
MPEEADVVRRATPGKEGDGVAGREHPQAKPVVERHDDAGRSGGDRVRRKPPVPDVTASKAKDRQRSTKTGKDKRLARNVLPRVGGGKGQRGEHGDVEPGLQVRRGDGKRDAAPHAEEDESLEERRPSEPTLQLTDEEIVEAQQRSQLVQRLAEAGEYQGKKVVMAFGLILLETVKVRRVVLPPALWATVFKKATIRSGRDTCERLTSTLA